MELIGKNKFQGRGFYVPYPIFLRFLLFGRQLEITINVYQYIIDNVLI